MPSVWTLAKHLHLESEWTIEEVQPLTHRDGHWYATTSHLNRVNTPHWSHAFLQLSDFANENVLQQAAPCRDIIATAIWRHCLRHFSRTPVLNFLNNAHKRRLSERAQYCCTITFDHMVYTHTELNNSMLLKFSIQRQTEQSVCASLTNPKTKTVHTKPGSKINTHQIKNI